MDREAALARMRDCVGLWYVGQACTTDIVYAACDLLVAGLDGPSLRMLAAVSIHHADEEVPSLLGSALPEVNLAYHPKGSPPAQEAGLKVMAARVLSGALSPRAMAAWAHVSTWDTSEPNDRNGFTPPGRAAAPSSATATAGETVTAAAMITATSARTPTMDPSGQRHLGRPEVSSEGLPFVAKALTRACYD